MTGLATTRVLLVPSLRLEGWKAMDRYAESLARSLPAVLPKGWTLAVHAEPAYPPWARFPARWLAYPRTVDWSRWDVVHVLDHSYAHVLHRRAGRARTVLTVHDLWAFDNPEYRTGLRGAALRRINAWVLAGITRADVCLCDSRATLDAVVRHFPAVAGRVRYETLGVDEHFFVTDRHAAGARGRGLLGIDSQEVVILHVGSCVLRKNIPTLLRGVARLAEARPAVRLVQVGGRFTVEQRALIDQLGLQARVRQHPHVPEEALPNVYGAADVLVLPSLFEGFGFPVLEAFAVGVPVVATRNASLADFPEAMLQSAGRGSVDEVAAAIEAVLDDPDAARSRAESARDWAREKTWGRVAAATVRAYTGSEA